jgi:hypothetical protein
MAIMQKHGDEQDGGLALAGAVLRGSAQKDWS